MGHKPSDLRVVRYGENSANVDIVVMPGLSIHIFGDVVGIYSNRIDAGRGFVEMPIGDLAAIVTYLSSENAKSLLEHRNET